jgi:rRNA methylases
MDPAQDTRNVVDQYKGMPNEEIVMRLDQNRLSLHVAIENFANDFNIGTVIRNANAFNLEGVHIIGRKHYNRRGAMVTDRYMHMFYHESMEKFVEEMRKAGRSIFAIDNVANSVELHTVEFPKNSVFIYGGESDGVSREGLDAAEKVVAIEQFGSTRSINVGVASGITMYAYVQQHVFGEL